jgi:hypothetical protein
MGHCDHKQGRILVEIVREVEKNLGEVQQSGSRPPWKVRAQSLRTGQSQRDVQYACSVHMYQCINEL